MAEVLVLVEQSDGVVKKVTNELITAARALGEPSAVVVDAPGVTDALLPQLKEAGAQKVYAAESDEAVDFLVTPQVDVLSSLAEEVEAVAIVIAATATGKEIAGRCAVRTGSGIVGDITELKSDGTSVKPIFGSAFTVTCTASGDTPVYTVKPGSLEAEPEEGAAERIDVGIPEQGDNATRITAREPVVAGDRPDLTEASIIVSGGRGVGSPEGFANIVEPLADALGGAVGASRAAVDSGYYPGQFQVGQTGKSVSPQLYIALGISGAIQHRAGMQTSKTIVVVNKDEEAPIFEISDFGVVGDLFDVAPQLTADVLERK